MHEQTETIQQVLRKIAVDELKLIRRMYAQGYSEEEIRAAVKENGLVIEHDQRPARQVQNYIAACDRQYNGTGARLFRNLYRH